MNANQEILNGYFDFDNHSSVGSGGFPKRTKTSVNKN